MDEDGHVCLTDFGLSKDVDPDNPEATTFCGTPEYLGKLQVVYLTDWFPCSSRDSCWWSSRQGC